MSLIHKHFDLLVTQPNQAVEKSLFSDKDDEEVVGVYLDYDKDAPNGDGTLGFFIDDTEVLPYDFPAVFINRGKLNLNPADVKHAFRERAKGSKLYFLYRDVFRIASFNINGTPLNTATFFKPYKVKVNLVFARYNEGESLPPLPENRERFYSVTLLKNNNDAQMAFGRFKVEYNALKGVTAAAYNGGYTTIDSNLGGQAVKLSPVFPEITQDTLQVKISGSEQLPVDYPVELYSIDNQSGTNKAMQEMALGIDNDDIEFMYRCPRVMDSVGLPPLAGYGIFLLFKCTEKR